MKNTFHFSMVTSLLSMALISLLLFGSIHISYGTKVNTSVTSMEDHNDLKSHIAKTFKYPATAKLEKISGYMIINLSVEQKMIGSISFPKTLHADLDREAMEAIRSFKYELEIPDGQYQLAIAFVPPASQSNATNLLQVPLSDLNFLGTVTILLSDDGQNINTWSPSQNPGGDKYSSQDINVVRDFSRVDSLPEFAGGLAEWLVHLDENMVYPTQAIKANASGRVILKFVVTQDGTIENIEIVRSVEQSLDEEAVRLLKASPKWKPGMQNGRAVKVSYTMPIFFQLALEPEEPIDFEKVEVKPEFPGGTKSLGAFILKHIQYPVEARRMGINGDVLIGFTIEKDGSLNSFSILKGIGGGADQESLRVIKLSPNWKPGMQKGQPVRVRHAIPVSFQMRSDVGF